MKILDKNRFERARDFILTQGRPLEKALFDLEFGGGSVQEVLTQLAEYQNSDGGLGKALEADVRTPTSSAICTEFGLRILAEIGTPAAHPMVTGVVSYLLDTFDPETQVWRVVPEDINDHPHAPWWHDEDESLKRTFDDFLVIPRAGILAYLHHYADLLPPDWLEQVTEQTVAAIMSLDVEKFGGGGDTLVYARRLAEAPRLEPKHKDLLAPRVQKLSQLIVTRDPAQWSQYSTPPLKLAPMPQSITAASLSGYLPMHLDYLVETQSPHGYWDVTWTWNDYPEEWEIAKGEWRGVLTLDALRSLRAFGRFE